MQVDSAKQTAKGKGVLREEESERSRRQIFGLTNRNHIRQEWLGEDASESKAPRLSGSHYCKCGRCMKRKSTFLSYEVSWTPRAQQ